MARRRWIADTWSEGAAALTGAQARHLARVLRGEPGMRYEVVAGDAVWLAQLLTVSDERAEFVLESELPAEQALPLTLMLAVFKFDRLEWAIEKATELGVARIVPVIARRTEKHLAQASTARVERWRRIVQEAAKQSRRADVPRVDDPLPLKAALGQPLSGAGLLLAENEHTVMLHEVLPGCTAATLAVGPAGGWAAEEESLFVETGWTAVSLGPRILRAETAAIASTAVAAALLLG